jgi:hypothetical protein
MHKGQIVVRVRKALERRARDCRLDEVPRLFPDLTWYQVFSALDQLRQRRQVDVTVDSEQVYWVQPHHSATRASTEVSAPSRQRERTQSVKH